MIDTRNLAGRRVLRFETIGQVLAELERLEAAEGAGRLKVLGNWSGGKNLGHLAAWVDYSYEGVPFTTPWFVKLMMKPMKKKFLWKPMGAGMRIPKLAEGTAGLEEMTFAEGARRVRERFGRLDREMPTMKHALFGKLTHEEWRAAHLRHAELHLSFMDG